MTDEHCSFFLRHYLLDDAGGISGNDSHGRNILCHHRIGTDNASVAECHTGENRGIDAEPYLILDFDGLAVGRAAVVGIYIVVYGDEVALGAR